MNSIPSVCELTPLLYMSFSINIGFDFKHWRILHTITPIRNVIRITMIMRKAIWKNPTPVEEPIIIPKYIIISIQNI
jgi:hypothetical protein